MPELPCELTPGEIMSTKPVTTAQVEQIRKMAKDKGVAADRFQKNVLDSSIIAFILDVVRDGGIITAGGASFFVQPQGVRIVRVPARVVIDASWQNSVLTACKDTTKESKIWLVEDLYPNPKEEYWEGELVFINYPDYPNNMGSWDKVSRLRKVFNLELADPRLIFAVLKKYGNPISDHVGPNECYLVATETCTLVDGVERACDVACVGVTKRADADKIEEYGKPGDWFVFKR
jgi:hypothetical protein